MPLVEIQGQSLYHRWHEASPSGGNGTTLVLVHGLGSSHAFYETIVPSLVERGYSCLTLDTPGSGQSKPGPDRSPADIAKLVLSLASRFVPDVGRIVAVGHSMGAMVVAELALQAPLLGAVMIGPVHPTPALSQVFLDRIANVRQNGLEALANAIPGAATGSKATATHRAFIRALILSQTPEGYMSLCRTIADAAPAPYSQASCPLLIIAGSDDKTSPLAGCRTILDSWGAQDGSKKIEVVEGVGHWHCVEAPDDVGRLVAGFAASL